MFEFVAELFNLSIDQVATGFKFTWAVLAILVTMMFIALKKDVVTETGRRLMNGVIFVSIATAIAQAYWGIWRMLRSIGQLESSQWFVTHGHWEAWVLFGIAFGYALHLGHILKDRLGKYWLAIALSGIGVMFLSFANLPKLVALAFGVNAG